MSYIICLKVVYVSHSAHKPLKPFTYTSFRRYIALIQQYNTHYMCFPIHFTQDLWEIADHRATGKPVPLFSLLCFSTQSHCESNVISFTVCILYIRRLNIYQLSVPVSSMDVDLTPTDSIVTLQTLFQSPAHGHHPHGLDTPTSVRCCER